MKMQKLGGWALIVLLCLVAVYIAVVVPLTAYYGLNEPDATLDPARMMAAYSGSTTTFKVLMPLGILIGILYLLIALAIQERMKAKAPNLMRLMIIAASVAAALRLANSMNSISGYASMAGAQDISIYRPFLAMANALSNAADHAWGWAVLLTALGALCTGLLPRLLGCVLLVLGILSVIGFALPTAGAAGTAIEIILAALYVIAMIWLAAALIRKPEPDAA